MFKTKLYRCRGYLFCNYELLEKSSSQIAKECGVNRSTILNWLGRLNIRIRTMSEAKKGEKNPNYGKTGENHPNYGKHPSDKVRKKMSIAKIGEKNPMFGRTGEKAPNYGRTGEKNPMYGKHHNNKSRKKMSIANTGENNPNYGKFGENASNWKGDDIKYCAIHDRAHKADPKPVDGKCAICNQVSDKDGITKLVHSNKDHTYKLPINSDEWQWIHESCHKEYDWSRSPERKKILSKRMIKYNANKREAKTKSNKDTSQIAYWFKSIKKGAKI